MKIPPLLLLIISFTALIQLGYSPALQQENSYTIRYTLQNLDDGLCTSDAVALYQANTRLKPTLEYYENSTSYLWKISNSESVHLQITNEFGEQYTTKDFKPSRDTVIKVNPFSSLKKVQTLSLQAPYRSDTIYIAYFERGCFHSKRKRILCVRNQNHYRCIPFSAHYSGPENMIFQNSYKRKLSLQDSVMNIISLYRQQESASPIFCGCTTSGNLLLRCRNEYVYLPYVNCCVENRLWGACKWLID